MHAKEINNKHLLPTTAHLSLKAEKQIFCHRLLELKLSDGYATNISKYIHLNDLKIVGLKSYDCYHIWMESLLSIVISELILNG